jgi:hypothetical protein
MIKCLFLILVFYCGVVERLYAGGSEVVKPFNVLWTPVTKDSTNRVIKTEVSNLKNNVINAKLLSCISGQQNINIIVRDSLSDLIQQQSMNTEFQETAIQLDRPLFQKAEIYAKGFYSYEDDVFKIHLNFYDLYQAVSLMSYKWQIRNMDDEEIWCSDLAGLHQKLSKQSKKLSIIKTKITTESISVAQFNFYHIQGLAYYNNGNTPDAIAEFLKAKAADSSNEKAFVWLVRSYLKMDLIELAELELKDFNLTFRQQQKPISITEITTLTTAKNSL